MTADADPPRAASSWRLAQQLGDALPSTADIADTQSLELVAQVRELSDAVVLTDIDPSDRALIASELAGITARLRARQRVDGPLLARRADGMLEHLTNAGSGRLNPHAVQVEFVDLPAAPSPGSEPRSVEVYARCMFSAAHAGSPSRVHGGVVTIVLDEVLGMAATVSGASGMTAELTVRFRAGTPYGVPVDATARLTHHDGRKSYATGELRVEGLVTAEATALFIAERST